MKKTIILLLAFVSILLNVSAQGSIDGIEDNKTSKSSKRNPHAVKKVPIKVTVSAKLHRPKRDCERGFGICDVTVSVTAGYVAAVGILFDNNDLQLDFQKDLHPFFPPEEDLSAIQVDPDESISLSPAVAEAFGKRSITILPGTYIVDYGSSTYGSVRLRTIAE
jgi:hypothetical protein